MRVCVIIAAAGRSERFGERDKLAQDMGGRPLLMRAVEPFTKRDEVSDIIVAGPPPPGFAAFKEAYGATLGFHGARVVPGGTIGRWETIREALNSLPDDCTHVAIHDAARPGVSAELLDRVFEAAQTVSAVVPGLGVTDTVKRVSPESANLAGETDEDAAIDAILGGGEGRTVVEGRAVLETVDRDALMTVQTPQVFTTDLLRRAYAQDDLSGTTDDASVVERMGETVYVVAGDPRNLKVTTPEDLELIRAILKVKPPKERASHLRF